MTEELNVGCLDELEAFDRYWEERERELSFDGNPTDAERAFRAPLRESEFRAWKAGRASLSTSKQAGAEPVAWLHYAAKKPQLHRVDFSPKPSTLEKASGWLSVALGPVATPPAVMPAAPSDAEWMAERHVAIKQHHTHEFKVGEATLHPDCISDALKQGLSRGRATLSQTVQPQAAQPAAGEQAGAVACNGVGHTALVEAVSRAILFADCGNSEHWEANTDLAEAAIKVCNARNPPRCSYCNSATSTPIYDAPHEARVAALASCDEAPATPQGEVVLWQWRRKGDPWTIEKTFIHPVVATTADSEVRALYTQPTTVQILKDHEIAKLVNDLRDVAKEFHGHQSLRERIAYLVMPLAKPTTVQQAGVTICEALVRLDELHASTAIDDQPTRPDWLRDALQKARKIILDGAVN